MQNLWQDIAALAVVVVAASYLARRVWPVRSAAGRTGCGGCSGCSTSGDVADGAGADDAQPNVIPIDQLPLKTRAIPAERKS